MQAHVFLSYSKHLTSMYVKMLTTRKQSLLIFNHIMESVRVTLRQTSTSHHKV